MLPEYNPYNVVDPFSMNRPPVRVIAANPYLAPPMQGFYAKPPICEISSTISHVENAKEGNDFKLAMKV